MSDINIFAEKTSICMSHLANKYEQVKKIEQIYDWGKKCNRITACSVKDKHCQFAFG